MQYFVSSSFTIYFVNLNKWTISVSFGVWGLVKRITLCECLVLFINFFFKDILWKESESLKLIVSYWFCWGVMGKFFACVCSFGLQGAAKLKELACTAQFSYYLSNLCSEKCSKSQSKHFFPICHCMEESWGSHI